MIPLGADMGYKDIVNFGNLTRLWSFEMPNAENRTMIKDHEKDGTKKLLRPSERRERSSQSRCQSETVVSDKEGVCPCKGHRAGEFF